MIDIVLLLTEALILGTLLGWVLWIYLYHKDYPRRAYNGLRGFLSRIRNMIPNKIDIMLYSGYLTLLLGLWLSDYPLFAKVVISGAWIIGLGLYSFVSRPDPIESEASD